MTDGKKDQLKRKKTLEYELRRLYRAGELTEQQIAELKEAEFPFDTPVRRTAKSVVRIDDGKKWPSCSAAEKELGITQGWMSDVCNMAQNGKWVAIKNQFYCFESMYSPDMDLTEIRGLAGWIERPGRRSIHYPICWICWRESMNVAHMIVHVTCTIFSGRSRAVGSTRVFTLNTWFHLPFQENVNCV